VLRALWDYNDPAASEQRLRAALPQAGRDGGFVLQTQIARTYGLRGQFDEARRQLKAIEPQLPRVGHRARAHWQLEWGRTWRSAVQSQDGGLDGAGAARLAYFRAISEARQAHAEDLEVDALHMMAFVESAPVSQLHWTRQALQLARKSQQPAARAWVPSLLNNAGVALNELGQFDEALSMFREARLQLAQRDADPQRLHVADWMIAHTLRLMGRTEDALALQRDLAATSEAAGRPDPEVFDELALLYGSLNKPGEAAAAQARASELRTAQAAHAGQGS